MPGEQIEINPDVLRWARERAGYTVEDLASTFRKIDDWETSRSSPTYAQLERLADKLKIPIAVFFFPEPPDVPPIKESFRTIPEATFAELPPRIRYLLRKAKAMQINLAELEGSSHPKERLVVRDIVLDPGRAEAEMASQVRDYIGITLDVQVAWSNADDAFDNWRKALEDVGVFVFKDAFRVDGFSGFCLYDDSFPIIYVNNSTAKTRQIFTLFHELAHLLFHTSGIDDLNAYYQVPHLNAFSTAAKRIEIACNRFASEFLLPGSTFEQAVHGKVPSEDTASEIANRFHLSREFVFRRFLDRQFITESDYRQAVKKWTSQRGPRSGGGNYYYTQISYLGSTYIDLAFREYHRNRINEAQLADYLDIKPKNLAAFEEHLTRGGA